MKTKSEFQAAIASEISNYPQAAERYRARDPSLLASLDAMAAMLAMLSTEQDVAAAEPFTKARDATVLADATAKGVLPFGLATRLTLIVTNAGSTPFTLSTGRRILDNQGRTYIVVAGITVPALGSENVVVSQENERRFDHTVTVTQPFYQIEVPRAPEGQAIVGVRVTQTGVTTVEYEYRPEYVNLAAGAKTFHLQSDASQRLLIEFGAEGLAGYAPQAGEVFTIIITDCEGAITIPAGSKFVFEYAGTPAEGDITMVLDEVTSVGRGVLDIPTMRTITQYPSIYDVSAVYLGNFDFLVRRNLSPFRFLSIWNEQTEEIVRGPDIDNINTLFVTALKDGVDTTDLQNQIKALILRADDSYKVSMVPVVEVAIPVTILARVHSVYDFAQVRQQIREKVLAAYGRDSAFSQSGQNRVLYRNVYRLLTDSVVALQGGKADIEVEVDDLEVTVPPEQYRYVSEASLTVTVEQAT